MNRTTKAKCSLFVFAISTIAATFLISDAPAYAKRRNCEAQFLINGKVVKGWTNLGKVGGFLANKKKKCKERAINYARNNIKYNQAGLTPQQVCDKYGAAGGATINFDTEVDGKRNSRDGSVKSWLGLKRCKSICTYKPEFKSTSSGGSTGTNSGGGSGGGGSIPILEGNGNMK